MPPKSGQHGAHGAGHGASGPHPKAMRKSGVVALRAEQRQLADLQDQKIDILSHKVFQLGEGFQIARKHRIELMELYESRRKEVREQIESIRLEIKDIFAKKHKEVKNFATEWMATLHVSGKSDDNLCRQLDKTLISPYCFT